MKFFHRYAGAKFHMPDGKEICFAGGEFDTDHIDPSLKAAVELELKKIANVPSSMIYTKEIVKDSSENAVTKEITDTAVKGFDTVNKVPGGTQTVAMPSAPDSKPTLNASIEAARAQVAAKAAENATEHPAPHHKK